MAIAAVQPHGEGRESECGECAMQIAAKKEGELRAEIDRNGAKIA